MSIVHFTQADMELFSKASHDNNPLHLSADFARRTAFGEPVVFGVLGALAALGEVPAPEGKSLSQVTLDFRNPLRVDANYRVEAREKSTSQWVVELFEGRRVMMSATFTFAFEQRMYETKAPAAATLSAPCRRTLQDLEGLAVAGQHQADGDRLRELRQRWHLPNVVADWQLSALLWTSYLVGMELPGEMATYLSLKLQFASVEALGAGPLDYRATVTNVDTRYDLIRIAANLASEGRLVAEAQIQAFVRADLPPVSGEKLEALLPRSNRLQGKVALVVGGSRGLGAAIAQMLAQQGATVLLNYARCRREAEYVQNQAQDLPGTIELLEGDAADVTWWQTTVQKIMASHGGLDILVCNASPSIRPLGLDLESLNQFHTFVLRSLSLVSTPLSALLDALRSRNGIYALVSSEYAQTAPPQFSHYVAAKCAVEGLGRSLAMQNKNLRCLLIRPPKLLTDQTNTPMGRQGTLATEQVAAAVGVCLLDWPCPAVENVFILDRFLSLPITDAPPAP